MRIDPIVLDHVVWREDYESQVEDLLVQWKGLYALWVRLDHQRSRPYHPIPVPQDLLDQIALACAEVQSAYNRLAALADRFLEEPQPDGRTSATRHGREVGGPV